ncbi:MerR family transcriptional regulator [Candidatus Nitrosoglobus terrae]|uniref:Mercuric resistance operon regulatory protein n=1 Tax=Candidatus Nitrosoglobus terrae TaxID=1630141 RepID=A0A1Q2SMM5_9GAMM|nr:MerR family transcriptional regulator [Candidatus Nitrosoglobus terrae]BAW80380.1 MerR family transcriptional regulator [Candidatus Nitrosoglobus terrae]
MAEKLTIGKLAAATGVSIETIRYYQRRGLLSIPSKPLNSHRCYPPEQIKRLRFIRRAKALGFTLNEIASLLQFDEVCACAETRAFATQKLQIIDAKLADLTAMRKALANLIYECELSGMKGACPIIHTLAVD